MWNSIMGSLLLLASDGAGALPAWEPADLVLVTGAPGESEYAEDLVRQTAEWVAVAEAGGHRYARIGADIESEPCDRRRLQEVLASIPVTGSTPVWLVFMGHGTFDGREARFNLRGPDVTPSDLAEWLEPFERPVIFINTASASAPFLPTLAGPNRLIVTATRSGFEQNATRFGQYLAAAWRDDDSDLDRDGQVSLLEACVAAWRGVAEFYQSAGRLRTENALLDDNGDGLGTPLDWFRGVRPVKEPREGVEADGFHAHQVVLIPSEAERALSAEVRARRDALERSIEALRRRKSSLEPSDYYAELEVLLLEMARLLVGSDATDSGAGDGKNDVTP